MGACFTVPYFTRLRILARQAGYFLDRLARLDARFDDCPRVCRNEYADPRNGCPDCEYTAHYRHFSKSYGAALRRDVERRLKQSVIGDTLPPEEIAAIVDEEATKSPTFEELLADYTKLLAIEELSGIETADLPGGHSAEWGVRTAESIKIIRGERAKVRRELRRKADSEIDAILKGLRRD